MKDLLLAMVKQMVDAPDQVIVKEVDGASTTVLELSVAKSDLGMVIGRKGNNINAIRTLMSASGAKQRKKVLIELME